MINFYPQIYLLILEIKNMIEILLKSTDINQKSDNKTNYLFNSIFL